MTFSARHSGRKDRSDTFTSSGSHRRLSATRTARTAVDKETPRLAELLPLLEEHYARFRLPIVKSVMMASMSGVVRVISLALRFRDEDRDLPKRPRLVFRVWRICLDGEMP